MTREALIRELRKLARKQGMSFEVVKDRGKGSHYQVYLGSRTTTIKSGELRPGYVKLIKEQLGVE
ncbi:MAG: type II toxin-antitoxin system HicA family toxin [Mesorhizobium sp.]